MRVIFLYLSIITCFSVAAQENRKDANGLKQGEWGKDFKNGQAKYRGSFKDGKPVGDIKHFYPNGAKRSVLSYTDNGKAIAVHYYTNGKKQSEGVYINQLKEGVWSFYNEDGVLRAKESYQKDKKQGVAITYFENGTKASETSFSEDVLDGKQSQYFESGAIMSTDNFTKGARNGAFAIFNPSGKPSLTGEHTNGEETGVWEVFDKDGTLLRQVYKLEVGPDSIVPQNGEYVINYGNEMPKEVAEYKTGVLHGTRETYYNNGEWELVKKVEPRTGDSDVYREMVGHTVKERCRYVYGKKHGMCEYFNEDGKLDRKEEYNMGVLVK